MEAVSILLLMWLAFGVVGRYVAILKRRSRWEGFLLGFLLGPIGVLVEALLPSVPAPARRRSRHLEGWQPPPEESPEEIEAFRYLTEGRRKPRDQV